MTNELIDAAGVALALVLLGISSRSLAGALAGWWLGLVLAAPIGGGGRAAA